ncbi:hypothetical protein HanPI659440_Chr03g0100601 [Helianthus annuus]|nr:hypothetical protein HanPI659440_Chr03g0100601 [Helianthus annuus]
MIREVLQFNDQETGPIELPAGTVEAILPRLSYEGKYPSLVKKFVHPYWRLLVHMFILCMTENRGDTYQLNITQSAGLTCLITNEPFNYTKYIFEGMKRNVTGVRKDIFLMYQRFLQMILNACYPELVRPQNTLELKPVGPACFGALTPKKGTEKRFEGLIPMEKFGLCAETEDVVAESLQVQPAPVDAAQMNAPLNAMVAEEHDVQGVAEDEPETKVLTITSNDEGIEIMCDSRDDEELPPESEADVVSMTEKMGNPPSNLSVSNKEPPSENPQDPDSLPLMRKRRDPRLGMYVEQNKNQPMNDAEDDDGLYDFNFEKNVIDTTTSTKDLFEFNVDTQRIDLETTTADAPVTDVISDPVIGSMPLVTSEAAGPSGIIHDEPGSASGKWPEEPLKMLFDDDSSDDDEFIGMRGMKKRLVVLEQDSIHKDTKIIQLEGTIVQKNQKIDQLQGDVSLLFNMVYDLRGKLEKKFGREFSDPTDVESRRKADEDRARAFTKDDPDRNLLWNNTSEELLIQLLTRQKLKESRRKESL